MNNSINTTKHTEFVRLVNNEPLTLYCSALADFLWDDFIRDARPSVTYLIDTYKITQLSRFGKELFERLYNADNVRWVVTENAFEDYFRKVCDGDTTAIPEGYKPENGIWYSIMGDLSQAAAWPELLQRSVGDQFNAGNNAVNLLNQLSELIEQAIKEGTFQVELLTEAGSKLQELRDKFKEAQAAGDQQAMNKARTEGKELGQKINEALEQAKQKLQSAAHGVVDNAVENHDDTNDNLSNLFGQDPGTGSCIGGLEEKRALANKLSYNKQLKALVKKLGALRQVWTERKRAKSSKANYEVITGAKFSDDVTKAFPAEIALAGSPEGRALFAVKYSQRTLLTKDYEAQRKDLGKGPIVMYVDVSGSMGGESELWSKAITFVIAEDALKERRGVEIHLFDTRVEQSISLSADRKNNKELLDFVGGWSLGGGTSFNAVLSHAVSNSLADSRSDVIMITDGHSDVNDTIVRSLNKFKQSSGTQWSTLCINMSVPEVCKSFSDDVYSVDIRSSVSTIDAIQKCIR